MVGLAVQAPLDPPYKTSHLVTASARVSSFARSASYSSMNATDSSVEGQTAISCGSSSVYVKLPAAVRPRMWFLSDPSDYLKPISFDPDDKAWKDNGRLGDDD